MVSQIKKMVMKTKRVVVIFMYAILIGNINVAAAIDWAYIKTIVKADVDGYKTSRESNSCCPDALVDGVVDSVDFLVSSISAFTENSLNNTDLCSEPIIPESKYIQMTNQFIVPVFSIEGSVEGMSSKYFKLVASPVSCPYFSNGWGLSINEMSPIHYVNENNKNNQWDWVGIAHNKAVSYVVKKISSTPTRIEIENLTNEYFSISTKTTINIENEASVPLGDILFFGSSVKKSLPKNETSVSPNDILSIIDSSKNLQDLNERLLTFESIVEESLPENEYRILHEVASIARHSAKYWTPIEQGGIGGLAGKFNTCVITR